MKCKDCRFFKYDAEYKNVGDCSKIFKEFIHIQYADAWFVEPEFGCIYGESATETKEGANLQHTTGQS
jgi:hypothetical protein